MQPDRAGSGAIERIHDSVLAVGEKRLLLTIARRLPSSVTPDSLTVIGVGGAALTFLGALAANVNPAWYFLAAFGLVINWFGDSLDGTVARVRSIERPRYGFFVDQVCDVLSHFLILIGLGLSPIMRMDIALLALLGSLATMFYGQLKLNFSRSWQVSHHGVGPTELRILIGVGLIGSALNILPVIDTAITGQVTLFDCVGFLVFVGAIAVIALMFQVDRAKLAVIDPPSGHIPTEISMVTIESGRHSEKR